MDWKSTTDAPPMTAESILSAFTDSIERSNRRAEENARNSAMFWMQIPDSLRSDPDVILAGSCVSHGAAMHPNLVRRVSEKVAAAAG